MANKTYNTIISSSKNYTFGIQDDGNAVLYSSSGEVSWSSLGSITSINNLQAQINALNVSGNVSGNFGAHVNIAAYTLTAYTCPSDGYIKALPNGNINDYISVYINNVEMAIHRTLTQACPPTTAIYVRKGMQVRVQYNVAPTAALFIPIS